MKIISLIHELDVIEHILRPFRQAQDRLHKQGNMHDGLFPGDRHAVPPKKDIKRHFCSILTQKLERNVLENSLTISRGPATQKPPRSNLLSPITIWLKAEGDEAYIGVTDLAQSELGDIVFIEVETVGEELSKGESFGGKCWGSTKILTPILNLLTMTPIEKVGL